MKKFNCFVIMMLLLSFAFGSVSFATDIDDFKEKKPVVIIEDLEVIPEAEAGGTLDLKLKYKNDSEYSAYNLKIEPIFEDMPLVYERPITFKRDKSLRANNVGEMSFQFKVADDAKLGVYGLKFKLTYSNLRDENYDNEQTVFFKIYKEKIKPIINISEISTGENGVSANNRFPLSFKLTNAGEVDASSVEILLNGLSANGFMAVDSNDYKYIGELKNGQSITTTFDMFASEDIISGTNTLSVQIKYKDTTGNDLSTEKTIYIQDVKSENDSEDDGSGDKYAKPKIIISSYSTNPKSIVAGNVFNFSFNFKNTSAERKLRNMKITISSSDGAFIITNGSNTFYIEEMDIGQELNRSIELRAKQDLASNSYPLSISFGYEDFKGYEYTAEETINIPVTEYSKLLINYVYAGEAYIDSNTSLSFDYINMGKATISNLTASVEGDYTSVQPINYIGNLAAGTSDYYDIEVKPTKAGTNYGVLVLSFEDSSGAKVEVKKEFEGFAMEMPVIDEDPGMSDPGMIEPMPPVETEEPVETWIIVVSGIGSFLVFFIITKVITTKIVRKKLEEDL